MRLKTTVPLHPDEATTSFVSRLVLANRGATIVDLLMDAELTMAQFLKGDEQAFEVLSALSGVAVHDLMRQAFVPVGTFAYQACVHELGQQHLLRGESRICPACLREDTASQLTPADMAGANGPRRDQGDRC